MSAEALRHRAPHLGPERAQLVGWLDQERAALADQLGGLEDAALRRAPVAGGRSLLDLVTLMTAHEARWFRAVVDGQEVHDRDEAAPPDATAEEVLHTYRAEIARSRMALARHELTRRVDVGGTWVTVRWVILHVIAETARCNGRAEVLRALVAEDSP